MKGGSEVWVLCGGVSPPDAPADALRLAVSGPTKNLTVDIAGISEELGEALPLAFKDLIRIASYVLAADSAIVRGDRNDVSMNRRWRRRFRFVVGVEDLDLWSSPPLRSLLEQTLAFLSDDDYFFEFHPLTSRVPEQLLFSTPGGEPAGDWTHVDAVALFSGGLDSLAGACRLVLEENKKVILVSHRSAPKIWSGQRQLVGGLQRRWGRHPPEHVGIQVVRHQTELRRERTHRSRSFLFASLAGAVAHLVGQERVLLFENGVMALNLPISPQIVGSTSTRTAHPKALHGFSRILTAVSGRPFKIENPFVLMTRAETLSKMVACDAAHLIGESVSCAHVTDRSSAVPHCGRCTQCIDRQFGILAAGLEEHDPEENYAVGLVRGEWERDVDRLLVLDYIAAADRHAEASDVDDFLSRCGEANRAVPSLMDSLGIDADQATRALYDLHLRHGKEVVQVLSRLHARHASDIRNGKLPPKSLLMLLFSAGLRKAGGPEPPERPGFDQIGENQFHREGEMWVLRFRGGRAFGMKPQKGLDYIRELLRRPGETLSAFVLRDTCDGGPISAGTAEEKVGRDTSGFATTPDGRLSLSSRPSSSTLAVDQKTIDSIRREIRRLQESRDEAAEFGHDDEVLRLEQEIEKCAAYLKESVGLGGSARREGPEQKRARDAVSKAVKRAVQDLARHSEPLADHLKENLDLGFFLRYRRTGISWRT